MKKGQHGDTIAIDAFKLTEVSITERGHECGGKIIGQHSIAHPYNEKELSIGKPRFRLQYIRIENRLIGWFLSPLNASARCVTNNVMPIYKFGL